MEWTQEDVNYIRSLRDNIDSDNIKLKQQIKEKLLEDKYIIHVLNNKELEEKDSEPSDYFGVNILPYYLIPETQTNVQNYICFETSTDMRYESVMKNQQIIFYILCEERDVIDKESSLPRHDLLAALIQNIFNYGRFKGGRFQLVSDVPSVTDSHFLTRTLKFLQITDNNLVKTVAGKPKIVNKDYWEATQI